MGPFTFIESFLQWRKKATLKKDKLYKTSSQVFQCSFIPWQSWKMLAKFNLDSKKDTSISKKYDEGNLLIKLLAWSGNMSQNLEELQISFKEIWTYYMY